MVKLREWIRFKVGSGYQSATKYCRGGQMSMGNMSIRRVSKGFRLKPKPTHVHLWVVSAFRNRLHQTGGPIIFRRSYSRRVTYCPHDIWCIPWSVTPFHIQKSETIEPAWDVGRKRVYKWRQNLAKDSAIFICAPYRRESTWLPAQL